MLLDRQLVKSRIHSGLPVDIEKPLYVSEGRAYLQKLAGEFIDAGDGVRGMICLSEVKRLDDLHKFYISAS